MAKKERKAEEIIHRTHDLEVHRLKEALASARDKNRDLLGQLHDADERLSQFMAVTEAVQGKHSPRQIQPLGTDRVGEAIPFLIASDWHIEERVDPKTVDGVNEFNPTIATARAVKFFQNGLAIIDMLRKRSRIDTLVLPLLGDLITNMIHDDQRESNYMSPIEAILKAMELVCGGIDFLVREGKFKKIVIPCSWGNHGRTTQKPRVSTAAQNSYEWLMYHILAKQYAPDPDLQFIVADGYFNFLPVYGLLTRLHHGDGVHYQGGVGGVDIPLNKAIGQWNKMRRVDLDVLGHWHTRKHARDFVINGSLIGFSPYSIRIKSSFEPPAQALFLIHPKYGKTAEFPIALN